ncbi:MAG TPA: flavin reductase family protein [Amycolatopsis sp.]|nr:flavin reductase family protein [Amycolatopsis sp.]
MAEHSTAATVNAVPNQPHRDDMRRVLGHVPTSVAVVTTTLDGVPVGSTVGTFTSVSLDPPLVAFFSQHTSDTLAAVRTAGRFAVNVLAADQADTCMLFAHKADDRFDRAPWQPGPHQNPHLHGALAVLECHVEAVTLTGDHTMVLGRVHELDAPRAGTEPLVFWRGTLHGVAHTPPDHPHYRARVAD